MDSQFREGLYILQEICGLRAIFPRTCEVSGKLSLSIMEPVEHGAFSTIYMGSIGEVDVLIKRPWYPTGDEGELEQVSHPPNLWLGHHALTSFGGTLQGDCDVEAPQSPEYCAVQGCHFQTPPTRVGMDA